MPFGLQGAPATFQRLMDGVIAGLEDFTSTYLDDMIIFSNTWEDHCVYLGHLVGGGIVQPEAAKVEAVCNFPVPTTKKQV